MTTCKCCCRNKGKKSGSQFENVICKCHGSQDSGKFYQTKSTTYDVINWGEDYIELRRQPSRRANKVENNKRMQIKRQGEKQRGLQTYKSISKCNCTEEIYDNTNNWRFSTKSKQNINSEISEINCYSPSSRQLQCDCNEQMCNNFGVISSFPIMQIYESLELANEEISNKIDRLTVHKCDISKLLRRLSAINKNFLTNGNECLQSTTNINCFCVNVISESAVNGDTQEKRIMDVLPPITKVPSVIQNTEPQEVNIQDGDGEKKSKLDININKKNKSNSCTKIKKENESESGIKIKEEKESNIEIKEENKSKSGIEIKEENESMSGIEIKEENKSKSGIEIKEENEFKSDIQIKEENKSNLDIAIDEDKNKQKDIKIEEDTKLKRGIQNESVFDTKSDISSLGSIEEILTEKELKRIGIVKRKGSIPCIKEDDRRSSNSSDIKSEESIIPSLESIFIKTNKSFIPAVSNQNSISSIKPPSPNFISAITITNVVTSKESVLKNKEDINLSSQYQLNKNTTVDSNTKIININNKETIIKNKDVSSQHQITENNTVNLNLQINNNKEPTIKNEDINNVPFVNKKTENPVVDLNSEINNNTNVSISCLDNESRILTSLKNFLKSPSYKNLVNVVYLMKCCLLTPEVLLICTVLFLLIIVWILFHTFISFSSTEVCCTQFLRSDIRKKCIKKCIKGSI